MKKYVTFVKDEEESRKVQEALFSAGFSWNLDGGARFTSKKFIHINSHEPKGLTHNEWIVDVAERIMEGTLPIESSDIIRDPFQLDGATQPEKMIEVDGKEYSASTIKAALQEYVK